MPGVGEVLDATWRLWPVTKCCTPGCCAKPRPCRRPRARCSVRAAIRYRLAAAHRLRPRRRARRGARHEPGRARQYLDCAHQSLPDESRPVRAWTRAWSRREARSSRRNGSRSSDPEGSRYGHRSLPVLRLLRISDARAGRFRRRQERTRRTAAPAATKAGNSNLTTTWLRANADYLVRQQGLTQALRADWPARCSPACRPEEPRLTVRARIRSQEEFTMQASSVIAPLFVFAGLVGGAARAAPVPPPELAEAQLRAINHRFVESFVAAYGEFMDAVDRRGLPADGERRLLAGSRGLRRADAHACAARRRDVRRRARAPVRTRRPVARRLRSLAPGRQGGEGSLHRRVRVERRRLAAGERQNTLIKDAVDVRQQTATAPAHAPWPGPGPVRRRPRVLRTLNENYVKAFREADVAWYDAHLAPDYVVASGRRLFS